MKTEIDEKRVELERLYSPHPPMQLIYKILIGGTIGSFLAIITARCILPEKIPQIQIIYPQQNYEQLAK